MQTLVDEKEKVLLVMRYYLPSDEKNASAKKFPKFDQQIEAVQELGYECVYYGISGKGLYRVCDGTAEYVGRLFFAGVPVLHRLAEHSAIYTLCAKEALRSRPKYIYIRSTPIVPSYVSGMRAYSRSGGKVIVEIPTYPPDKEAATEKRLWRRLTYQYLSSLGKKAAKYIDLYTLIGEPASSYNGRPAINIMNGTSVKKYKEHKTRVEDGSVHIMALAGMANYNGFDRLIRGIDQYRRAGGKTPVYLHLVGPDGDGSLKEWRKLTGSLELEQQVLFEGEMTGAALDDMFDRCDIASSSLAGFRIGVHIGLNLKTAEYCSRGIPFICCGLRSNAKLQVPHCYDAIPETEEAVDMEAVVQFALDEKRRDHVAEELRAFAEGLSWKSQLKKAFERASISV